MPTMTASQRTGFVSKFLKTEAKGQAWLSKLVPELQPLSERLINAYQSGPAMNARTRKAFVREFAAGEAMGSIWLTLLLPLIVPILQRLLEAFLNREAE